MAHKARPKKVQVLGVIAWVVEGREFGRVFLGGIFLAFEVGLSALRWVWR